MQTIFFHGVKGCVWALIRALGGGLRDLGWLLFLHLLILLMTALTGGLDQGDLRVHAAIVVFLLPGWWLAPWLSWGRFGIECRYLLSTVISFALHAWLAGIGSLLSLGFDAYYITFALFSLGSLGWFMLCAPKATHRPPAPFWTHAANLLPAVAALVLVAVAFRIPYSNDIRLFLPQQIDMALHRQLAPSALGMTSFGIDEVMPRWQAHLYHVWFSLLVDVTHLPADYLVLRWATIPLAVMAILALGVCITTFTGRRTPTWMVLLAIFAPVTLCFRDFTPYPYAFRLTNNLCLDKDFALFWLIPCWLWICHGALVRGAWQCWALLLVLVPVCLRFHPVTSIYLLLLLPFLAGSVGLVNREGARRLVFAFGIVLGLCVALTLLGEAEAAHQQMEALVHLDAQRAQTLGRPLHYWVGHYATIPGLGERSDSITSGGGQVRLRFTILTRCGLLLLLALAMFVRGFPVLALSLLRRRSTAHRRWAGIALAFFQLLGILLLSRVLLQRAPHLFRGIERLHWFCFVPALVAVTQLIQDLYRIGRRYLLDLPEWPTMWRWSGYFAPGLLSLHLVEQASCVLQHQPTVFHSLPVLRSIFDHHAGNGFRHRLVLTPRSGNEQPVLPPRPPYLLPQDRVLLLTHLPWPAYWELRQGVWWPQLYGEAFAYARLGERFLDEWRAYYDCVDGEWSTEARRWIHRQRVTLIVDARAGAADSLTQLAMRSGMKITNVAEYVWRITP